MRAFFLWSILNLIGGGFQDHIVLQTPPMVQDHNLLVRQAFPHDTRKLIHFSNDFRQEEGITTVPLRAVYHAREEHFPQFHPYSRSHFLQFTNSIYASVMEYEEFCKMEDKLAHIVGEYLGDRKNHWLVMMDDPFLMGSIRGYLPTVDRSVWITTEKTSFNDMLLTDLSEYKKNL